MLRKVSVFTFALFLVLIIASVVIADPMPPEKGQWAFPLESSLPLYEKADANSEYEDVDMPEKWLKVPSAVRDNNNNLWYKVTVDDKTGWLPQNGIRLKMGSKSKSAANLYKNYVKARNLIVNKKVKGWRSEDEHMITTYTSDGGQFQILKRDKKTEDVYFESSDGATCKFFFGFNPIGMNESQIRSKLGTPTTRETPYDEPEMTLFSYELDGKNLVLSVRLYQNDNTGNLKVETIELNTYEED